MQALWFHLPFSCTALHLPYRNRILIYRFTDSSQKNRQIPVLYRKKLSIRPSYRTQQTSNRLNKEPSYPLNNTNIIDYSKYSTNTNNDYPKYYNDKDNFTLTRDKKYTNTDINVDDYLGKKNKIEDSDDEYNNLHEQLDDLVDYISKLKQSE